MRKLNLALLLVAMMIPFACAAQQPSEYVGLIIFDGGGNPIPAPSTGTDVGPLPQTYVGALCWNSGLSKWVKADSSCFGGGGGGGVSGSGTATHMTLWVGATQVGDSPVTFASGLFTFPDNVEFGSNNLFWDNTHNVLEVGPNASTLLTNPPIGWAPLGAWTNWGPVAIFQSTAPTNSEAVTTATVLNIPNPFPVGGPGDSQVYGAQTIAQYTSNSTTASGTFFGAYSEADVYGTGIALPVGFDSEVTNNNTAAIPVAYGNQAFSPWNTGSGTIAFGAAFDAEPGDTPTTTGGTVVGYNCDFLPLANQYCFRSAGAQNDFGTGDSTFGGTVILTARTASELLATDGSNHIVNVTALPNGTTATTQSVGDNTTKVATDAFVIANAGGSAFSAITSGTNANTLTMGSGGSIVRSGTGIVDANQINSATLPISASSLATNGSGQIIAGSGGSGNYTNIGGSVTFANCTYASGVCTTTGTVSTVTISSIPGTFLNLVLKAKIILTGNSSQIPQLQFNSDTASNYGWGVGGGYSGGTFGSGTNLGGDTGDALCFSSAVPSSAALPLSVATSILDYAGSTPKETTGTCTLTQTGGLLLSSSAGGFWSGTSAITLITLKSFTGSIAAGTKIYLYGEN